LYECKDTGNAKASLCEEITNSNPHSLMDVILQNSLLDDSDDTNQDDASIINKKRNLPYDYLNYGKRKRSAPSLDDDQKEKRGLPYETLPYGKRFLPYESLNYGKRFLPYESLNYGKRYLPYESLNYGKRFLPYESLNYGKREAQLPFVGYIMGRETNE
jgi:hypothetical protein